MWLRASQHRLSLQTVVGVDEADGHGGACACMHVWDGCKQRDCVNFLILSKMISFQRDDKN